MLTLNENNTDILRVNKYKYWDIDTTIKENDAENELKPIIEDAIHIRTRSDVPIGVLLSGGLDSSCIVAEIADYYASQGRGGINTFTSCYENFEEGNEQKFAEMVNDYCKTTQNFIFPDAENTLEQFENMVWHLEGDCGLNLLGSYLMLQQIAKSGAKVLINGQGSDETQLGYERYYAWYFKDLLKRGHLIKLVKAFKDGKNNSKLSAKMLAEYFVYFSSLKIRKNHCLKRMRPFVTDKVVKEFKENSDVNKFIKQKNMQELQYNELRGTQLTHILRMDDRLYMSQSMESRVPYIDYRYIEQSVKVPEERKIQEGYTKYLLRQMFKDKLPAEVIWRKNKMGWPSPKNRWAKRFDDDKMMQLFDTARTSEYFNTNALKQEYKKNPASRAIEQFLVVEFFVRKFDVMTV